MVEGFIAVSLIASLPSDRIRFCYAVRMQCSRGSNADMPIKNINEKKPGNSLDVPALESWL